MKNFKEINRTFTVKKNSIFNAVCKTRYLALLVVLIFTCGNAWGTEEVVYTLSGATATGGNSAPHNNYASAADIEENDITWSVTGNSNQTPWRIGGQSINNVIRPLYSKTAISDDITKVVVTYGGTFNLTSASAVLKVYSTAAAAESGGSTNLISTVNGDNGAKPSSNAIAANATHTFTRPAGHDWAGRYFRFEFTCKYTSSSNKYFQFSTAEFYAEASSGYSITYHCNGATSGCPGNASGQTALPNPISEPTKTGFTFGGWYTDANLATAATPGATLSANADLYAKWTCNVTLNRNGATEVINNVVEGTTLNSIDGDGAQGGCSAWTFVGWSKTQRAAQDVSTEMTLVTTVDGAGPYYAVYSHTESGGSGSSDMEIDFEENSDTYTDWTFTNLTSAQTNANVTAHGGSYFGSTAGTATASITTDSKIDSPESLTVYVTKQTTNTTSSTWYIQVSTDGSSWTDVTTQDATSMSRGTWVEVTSDLSSYSEVYVRVYYSGSTAVRNIDDLTLTYTGGSTTYYSTTATCCTELGTINGSINSSTPTSVTLQWDKLSGVRASTPYVVSVSPSADESVGSVDLSGAKATCSITGLTPCTAYTFTINAYGDASHCDKSDNVAHTTTGYTYTITKNNVTLKGGETETDNTCSGDFMAEYVANTGYALPTTISVSGASDYEWDSGVLAIDAADVTGNVTVTITGVAQSTSYRLWTGWGNGGDLSQVGNTWDWVGGAYFVQVGSSNEWQITNYTIPNHVWTGSAQMVYNVEGKNPTNTKFYDLAFAASQGTSNIKKGPMPGAVGTLRMYDNYGDPNGYLGFLPNNYMVRFGTHDYIMTETSSNVWETAIQTLDAADLTNASKYRVGCTNSSDEFVAINEHCPETAVTSMGQRSGASTWGSNLAAGDAGKHGKFRIWLDNATDNWTCHFVPYYKFEYDGNGATSGTTPDPSYISIEAEGNARNVTVVSNPYSRTGYTFVEWNTQPDGEGTTIAAGSRALTADLKIYAIWNANTISLTLDKNNSDAAGTDDGSGSIDFDATSGTISTAPTRTGHTVEGYYTDAACTAENKVLDASGNVINSTVSGYTTSGKWTRETTPTTLYTKWTPINYTVTWHVGDATSTSTVAYNTEFQNISVGKPSVGNSDLSSCESNYFVGWVTSGGIRTTDGGTVALYNDNKVNATDKITGDTDFYAMFATSSGSGVAGWVETGIADLTSTDVFVIVGDNGDTYAMTNVVTSPVSHPVVASVTISNGKITSAVADNTKWNISGNSTDGYTFYPNGDVENWLYCTNTNNGVWVGTGDAKVFTISDGYLYETGTSDSRYIGIYNSQDWRCYTANTGNIADQTFAFYKYDPGVTYSNYRTNCAACANSVTVSYDAAPTGATVAVTKGEVAIANNGTVKTCDGNVSLTVTITPASHFTVTGLTAQISSTDMSQSHVDNVYTVTIPQNQTGTLVLTPTLTEDAHVAINWHVPTGSADITAGEGKTWVYSGGNLTAIPGTPSNPTGCSEDKTFVGWSEKHSGSTEEDASYYDDLFSAIGDAPTGITSQKDFYAVYAHGSSNPLAGTVIWDEPFTGFSADDVPTAKSSGATVYNSTALTYACADGGGTTKIYSANLAGGTSPELLVAKSGGSLTVSNIPTAGQTELTLSYKSNAVLDITSGTSGVTIGDPSIDGSTYTRTITISQSPSAVNNFSLAFTKSTSGNARLDDIHLVVPGSGTYTNYVTDCEAAYIITYYKNTTDAVTNLPGPTGIPQSTGSGTLSNKVPARETYTFLGWATTAGGNVAYAAGASISSVSADMDLYAVWEKTAVEELTLNYSELNKYVGDASVTLEVTDVSPTGADPSVTWSSNNSGVASVVAATGVVTFGSVGTATITATSSVTGTTTAYCYVTVRNKPTATFIDLIHNGNGTTLSDYNLQDVAGTAIVFPTLSNATKETETCDDQHYVFVGWTTSDNNTDPEDHLVSSGVLEDDNNKTFYAVWADGVEGYSYTKLTTNSFKTSPTKYVIGAEYNDQTYYFYSCAATDENNGNGGCTTSPATNAPIQFTLSGTDDALVATSTEATARYLKPLTANNFQMSATTKTLALSENGDILNAAATTWALRFNTSNTYLRWYNTAPGSAAYFYEVVPGATVSYRTSCCTNNVAAPTVVATNTAYTVTLSWGAVADATGYEVSWNNGAWTAATSPVNKTGLTASTTYIYKVRATYDPLVKCGALVASGNVTTDDVYTVTYQRGSGTGDCNATGTIPAVATYEAGRLVTLVANPFTLSGNIFDAWSVKDANDNVVAVNENQFTMPASNVTVTATWTPRVDKYYDLIHDQTATDPATGDPGTSDGLHYYITREGCNYTVPSLSDDDSGSDNCHATHEKLLGWIAQSNTTLQSNGSRTVNADCINPDGTIKTTVLHKGGTSRTATGATYYAIWAVPVIE